MFNHSPVLFPVLLLFTLTACSDQPPGGGKTLASINNFNLDLANFQAQLADKVEFEKDFQVTRKAKQELLEEIIRKELLIQEAVKLRLDRDEKFIRAIERHWEATLIKDILEMKSQEISRNIVVSEEEIEARHRGLIAGDGTIPPLAAMREELAAALREEKKTRALEAWMNALKQAARIEINQELFSKD